MEEGERERERESERDLRERERDVCVATPSPPPDMCFGPKDQWYERFSLFSRRTIKNMRTRGPNIFKIRLPANTRTKISNLSKI